MSPVRHWLEVHFLRREIHQCLSCTKFLAEDSAKDNRFVVDARQKGLDDVGLSPSSKKAVVPGLRWERDYEFCQFLFLIIVRSEQENRTNGAALGQQKVV